MSATTTVTYVRHGGSNGSHPPLHHLLLHRVGSSNGSASASSPTTTSRKHRKAIQTVKPIIVDSKKAAALQFVLDKYFLDKELWTRSRFLCVGDDPDDGARRALEYARWNVEEASGLIEANLAWRAKDKIDELLQKPLDSKFVSAIRGAFKDEFAGFDLDGYPMYWCPAGMIDIASLKDVVGLDDLVKYHLQTMEFNQQVYLRRVSRDLGKTIHSFTCVVDMRGFGARNLNKAFRETLSVISTLDRDYYYDNFHKVIILNAPLVFRLFWKTTSALYRAETKAKFVFLDKPSDLSKYVTLDQVPERFKPLLSDQPCVFPADSQYVSAHAKEMDVYMIGRCVSAGL